MEQDCLLTLWVMPQDKSIDEIASNDGKGQKASG